MRILLAITALIALCTDASSQTHEKCLQIKKDANRLECFDLVFRKFVKTESNQSSNWRVKTETSKLDDTNNIFASLDASEPTIDRYGRKHHPALWIACRENKTSMWISFDNHMSDHRSYGTVTFRIDALNAFKKDMRESTDNRALGLWSGGQSVPFIKSLFGHTTLIVRATPYGESAVTLEFPILNSEHAIAPLRKACNW